MREIYLLYNEKRNIIPALKNNMLEQQWDMERHGIWGVTLTLTNHNTLFCSTHMCAHNLVPIHYILTNLGLSGHYSHNIFKPYSITFMNSFLYCVKRKNTMKRAKRKDFLIRWRSWSMNYLNTRIVFTVIQFINLGG